MGRALAGIAIRGPVASQDAGRAVEYVIPAKPRPLPGPLRDQQCGLSGPDYRGAGDDRCYRLVTDQVTAGVAPGIARDRLTKPAHQALGCVTGIADMNSP